MASVRRTSVAGTWYPDNPTRLVSHLDGYLERARIDDVGGRLRAIVVPHAGLMYSGPVAAYAYNVARRHHHSALVLVGPSHFIPFDGVSMWPDGEWETPLVFKAKPRRVGLVKWRRLPENALLAAIAALIKGARDVRLASYQTCVYCGRRIAPEWLHDEGVCQSCADQHSGAIH